MVSNFLYARVSLLALDGEAVFFLKGHATLFDQTNTVQYSLSTFSVFIGSDRALICEALCQCTADGTVVGPLPGRGDE